MKIDATQHAMAHFWQALNADTGEKIEHVVWADEEAAQCLVYVTDSSGRFLSSDSGELLTKTINVNVKLAWVGDPSTPDHVRIMPR